MGYTSCKDDLMAYSLSIIILSVVKMKSEGEGKKEEVELTYTGPRITQLESIYWRVQCVTLHQG